VEQKTGFAKSTIRRRERAGEFPKRKKLGPHAVGWDEDEIEAFLKSCPIVDGDDQQAVRAVDGRFQVKNAAP
jgi:predicted DNA-binding transcriptional regulator AlpA